MANITKPLRPVSADGACFVAGTLVHTNDGLIPIEQIEVSGQMIVGCKVAGSDSK